MTGTEPDMQTFWQLTHKRGNGEWIDEASKEINVVEFHITAIFFYII